MKKLTKEEFQIAEKKMNAILTIVTQKGGFDKLTEKESTELAKYTKLVHAYEEFHFTIPLPETLQGLNELKTYEKSLNKVKKTPRH